MILGFKYDRAGANGAQNNLTVFADIYLPDIETLTPHPGGKKPFAKRRFTGTFFYIC
jgi:hypothetical protein